MTTSLAHKQRVVADQPLMLPNRRLYKRYQLTLLGRFMRASKDEFPCKMVDISVGGVSVLSPVAVRLGERIVAYFDLIGGLEGEVVRIFDGGFAIQLSASPHKREKLAAQITWLINRDDLANVETRRHERTNVSSTSSMKLADNVVVPIRVIDISISGASVATDQRPPIGTEVVVGRLKARVMRHHTDGIGVQFLDIQQPDVVRRTFP